MSLATTIQIGDTDGEMSYGDVPFPRYATTKQIAAWAGEDERWVQAQVRRGVATPVLFKGERQFDRPGTLRLLLLARLKQIFGDKSSLPFALVEAAGPAIDDLLKNPSAGTSLALHTGGRLNVVVGVPGLADLLVSGTA